MLNITLPLPVGAIFYGIRRLSNGTRQIVESKITRYSVLKRNTQVISTRYYPMNVEEIDDISYYTSLEALYKMNPRMLGSEIISWDRNATKQQKRLFIKAQEE